MSAADVGIFLCCLTSIACKARAFTLTQTAGNATLGVTAAEAEHHLAQAVPSSPPRPSSTPPFAAAAVRGAAAAAPAPVMGAAPQVHTSVGVEFRSGAPQSPGYDYSLPPREDEAAGAATEGAEVYHRADDDDNDDDDGDDDNNNNSDDDAGDARGGEDLIVRVFSLPLTQRIMMGVNWLSVISNCLTYFLRPSQVLYAFLLCSSDMMLYVVTGSMVGGRRRRRSASTRSLGPTPATYAAPAPASVALEFGEEGCHSPAWAERCAAARQQVLPRRAPIFFAKYATGAYGEAGVIPSHASTGTEFDPSVEPGAGQRKSRKTFRYVPRLINQRSLFIVALNMALLFALVIFHLHHLFFWVGTVTGYLASCGTLYVLGCEVGVLLQMCGWLRLRRSARSSSSPSSLPPVALAAALSSVDLRSASLPPAGVMVHRRLRVLYVTHLVFSFACSAFYFSMLLEEGAALYSTHLEFMRWYVGTVGLGLLDLARLLLFGAILWLGAGREGKNRRRRPHGVGETASVRSG
ncbi:uncharacterized protein Tco025E_08421 [Trypanosoma conorhini]|uniref:Uncharacterized protein n=1 Tax=Trypanosoma conorhini TaxID=83891 RepID=A0A3R7LS61_9TRYP|nr:uncharacterized protein Tco025E_08421 [Trypanosoma conorhini]RNF02311.1 hypothetical protein Tco025E_08421 [Trypanosoma conorhini]